MGAQVSSAVAQWQAQETLSSALARFVAQAEDTCVPSAVHEKVALHVLDTLGVALAAVGSDFAGAAWRAVDALGSPGAATCIGRSQAAAPAWAALANGILAHGLDYDDTHAEGVVHVSAPVVPAALAVAESIGAAKRDFLTAVALGMETSVRIAVAAPGAFHDRGFHPTPIAGTFGATVAAARLLHLNEEQIGFALGLAGSQAAGTLEFLGDGSWSKRLHAGWAAHAGVVAATFGRERFSGPAAVLEGRFGLYRTHLGDAGWKGEVVCDRLGSHWRLLEVSLKPYAACHMTHACCDAARKLRLRPGFALEEIERVECWVHPRVFPVVCEPRKEKLRPSTDYQAKFSLPYTVACMLVRGRLTLQDFSPEAIRDEAVLALAQRIACVRDPASRYPEFFDGRVRLFLRSGDVWEEAQPINRGHPQLPLTRAEVEEKFRANAVPVLGRHRAEAVAQWLSSAGEGESVRPLCRWLRPPVRRNKRWRASPETQA